MGLQGALSLANKPFILSVIVVMLVGRGALIASKYVLFSRNETAYSGLIALVASFNW
jgi:hypothetical protein